MERQENPYWSEEVHTSYHPPEGTFTHSAEEVVQTLMEGADNNPTLALHRLIFYMNRAGEKLTNVQQLNKAKYKLEALIKQEKETTH